MNSPLSPSEIYSIELENDEPKYYARIPRVIYHCTFITKDEEGRDIRCKLRPTSRDLYCLLKQITGEKGACWANRDYLADMLGCSVGAITSAKKELTAPLEQLNGKSLISIEKRKKRNKDRSGGAIYDHITINNVWAENNAFITTLQAQPEYPVGPIKIVDKSLGRSIDDEEMRGPSLNDVQPLGGPSYSDTNNSKQKKIPSVKETEPAAGAAAVCYFPPESSVIGESEAKRSLIVEGMKRWGADDGFIREMLSRFPLNRILGAAEYTAKQHARGQVKRNRLGYLRYAIEKDLNWRLGAKSHQGNARGRKFNLPASKTR